MSSTKAQDEKKRLKNFLDKNASLNKRWKSLLSYSEKASPEDINKFFNENFYMIYGVFLDSFTAYEAGCKKGKHSLTTMIDITDVLRNVLFHLSELIRKKWQTRSISVVLEKLLYKENKIALRLVGVELLMMFIEDVQVLEPSQVELLASAIDLGAFCSGANQAAKFKVASLSAPDKLSILVPSTTAGSVENSVKLWDALLAHISSKPALFEFWFELIKQNYFAVMYTQWAKANGITKEDFGFLAHCPHQIQTVIIGRLDQWIKNDAISAVLWSSEENIQLLLEIFRQSCSLPITYLAQIRESIHAFNYLFFGTAKLPEHVTNRLVEFRKFFIEQVAEIFSQNHENVQDHLQLCTEVINLLKSTYFEQYDKLAPETRESLLQTILNTAVKICTSQKLASLSDMVLDTVFYIWIKSGRKIAQHMWDELQKKISSTFVTLVPLKHAKTKLIQLTLIIKQSLYPEREKKPPNPRKNQQQTAANQSDDGDKPNSVPTSPDTPAPLPNYAIDHKLVEIGLSVDELLYVWKQVLFVFNTVNSIKDVNLHAEGIASLCAVVDILKNAEENVPAKELSKLKHPLLSLINIFGNWLFEASFLPDTYLTGKAVAVGTLCKIVVRHHGDAVPLELLSHFYATIQACLQGAPNTVLSWAIIEHGSNLFNLALPGSNVLIPAYLNEVRGVLRARAANPSVLRKSVLICASLICYANHFQGLTYPTNITKPSTPVDIFKTLNHDIANILITAANNSDLDVELKVLCIWSLCSLVFEEVLVSKNLATVKEIIKTILPFCLSPVPLVSKASLDCLGSLVIIYKELKHQDEGIIHLIIDILCSNIKLQLDPKSLKNNPVFNEQIVADHFYCLQDWIVACNTCGLFDKKQLAYNVFSAIEAGVVGLSDEGVNEGREKEKRKAKKPKVVEVESVSELAYESMLQKPTHGSVAVAEAAYVLLLQICNFMQTFPNSEGIEISSSHITENDDTAEEKNPLFFIYNDTTIFSIVQLPEHHGTAKARIILRDSTGKYAWDCLSNYTNYIFTPPADCSLLQPVGQSQEKTLPVVTAPDSARRSGEMPVYQKRGKSNRGAVDQIDEMLRWLTETAPDCLIVSNLPLNQPHQLKEASHREQISVVEKKLLEQDHLDQKALASNSQRPYEDWQIHQPPICQPKSATHYCRLLMHQFGFLEPTSANSLPAFSFVENSSRFQRNLSQLDSTPNREMIKIGVIYVKETQDDQKIILLNDLQAASPLYTEFVRGLGWPIDIATHKGYLGGLDRKLTTGTVAPYFANHNFEVIFHDITCMPNQQSDSQQIHKKRHVGNDIVHIVYSEHTTDYNPSTITSQFNDVHICVYPLLNGLFRIQIYRKDHVPVFGPLVHGMCINKQLLPLLVRQSAINANRAVRYNSAGYIRPFPTRQRIINEIVEKYKTSQNYEELLTNVASAC